MNTPAHLIFGAAAFARPGHRWTNVGALAGGLVPDVSLYLMAGWALYVQGAPARTVFGQMYFSDAWQSVFAVDNSIPLWTLILVAALALRWAAVVAFAGAGLLHLGFDFALHHDDARRHFWPLSDWVFASPVSYWDRAHFGNVVGPLEIAVCLILSALLWRRFRGWQARAMILTGIALEAVPGILFAVMFAAG